MDSGQVRILADERTHARLTDLADEWNLTRLVDLENRVNLQFKNGREVEDRSSPSCSGVNPDRVRPGPRTNLKHDGGCPCILFWCEPGLGEAKDLKYDETFSGVNPGQDIERPGPRTDLKHDGSCPSFSGVNPGLVRLGPRTELKHKLSVLQNAVFYRSGVVQSDRGVSTVPKSSIDQTRTCCLDPTCNKQVCRRRRGEECDGPTCNFGGGCEVLCSLFCGVWFMHVCGCTLIPACACNL